MTVMKNIIFLLLIMFSTASFSSTMLAICSQLEGSRITYFKDNPNEKNSEFLISADRSSGSELRIAWKENSHDAIISISDTSKMSLPQTHFAKAVSIFTTPEQISFVGILNRAPIMVTLYPDSKVAIYSMQSNWGTLASGVRANLFHAVCEIKKTEF